MVKRTAQEQFDQQAAHYNAQWNAWNEDSLRWMLEHAECQPTHEVLDVATGTGFTALAFAPLVKHVTGVDVSEGMLEQARTKAAANVTFRKGAAESLPFGDAQFDLVTCRVAPHHFVSVPKFLAESYRVLRAGGKLIISDTTVPDDAPDLGVWQHRVELLRDTSHMRNHSPRAWRKFAEAAGFVVDEIGFGPETKPITLRAWLEKGGCTGEGAQQVRRLFAEATPEARATFAITPLPDGDTAFQWLRVVLAARKPHAGTSAGAAR
jgi:ubiquinone/menaquinone biosynthesis C-methylase UbiE